MNASSRSFKRSPHRPELGKLSKSTGANTPNDSAIYSTSDSEGDKDSQPPHVYCSPIASVSVLHPAPPRPMTRINPPPLGAGSHATSLSSQLHTARPSLEARTQSPVARMGSSSSRSREDIISWARGVDSRRRSCPDGAEELGHSSSTVRQPRGRQRRPDALANLAPPSTEPLDEPADSTPTGTFGGALNLSFGPVVNVFRNVSLGSAPVPQEHVSALGLQTMPAPAEVSIVDVVVATRPRERDDEHGFFSTGDTPTLSTLSVSEAADPSTTTDFADTIESTTDDYSVISSLGRGPAPISTPTPHHPQARRKSSLRPIQSTATAIWNFSTYLRSLAPFTAPFSLVSAMAPAAKPVLEEEEPDAPTPEPTLHAPSPVPAPSRVASAAELVDSVHDLVRSVPLDIVITPGSKAQVMTEERVRDREALEFLGPRSRSRTRIQASRSPSPGGDAERERHSSRGSRSSPSRRVERESSDDDRRGRGRGRGRKGSPSPERDAPSGEEDGERRGRRRDRGGESRDRSWSAVRGRTSRTRGSAVRAS